MTDLLGTDPFAEEHRDDPHPLYHRMRREDPVLAFEGTLGTEWVLTRYEDCLAVLRDPRWSSSPTHRQVDPETSSVVDRAMGGEELDLPIMLMLDPPDHTRLRRLVSKAFTPRAIEQLRGRVAQVFEELLAAPVERGELEVIAELAYPLPVTVICEMLGVPVEDRDGFQGWSSDASRLLDGDIDEATAQRGVFATMSFINYFNELFEQRRSDPGDDLISGLLAVEDEGDRLTHPELLATVLLLFIAGHETTMNLIGNGLFQLLSHRGQWDRLVEDPGGMAPATVEECLRFDGPVHLTARTATEPLELGGRSFEAGDTVIALLAAANRDPAAFVDPDTFDITRADNHHLTFSHGMHYCLGAALARLEGTVVFAELARRFPAMSLVTTAPARRDHFILRGLEELRVSLV